MKKVFTFLVVALFGLQLSAQKYTLEGDNLVKNPNISDTDENGKLDVASLFNPDYLWTWYGDESVSEWDQTVDHTGDGSGSWKMQPEIGQYSFTGLIEGSLIKVNTGDEITFSVYLKAQNLPSPTVSVTMNCFKKDYGSYWQFTPAQKAMWKDTYVSFKQKDDWVECVFHGTVVDTVIGYVAPYVLFIVPEGGRTDKLDGVEDYSNYGAIWVDDMHVSKQSIGFKESPTVNRSFNSQSVSVDAQGNISAGGNAIFPIAVWGDETKDVTGYREYVSNGFNMEARASSSTQAKTAVDAGMYYAYDFTKYIEDATLDVDDIATEISELSNQSILENCIFWYVENNQVNTYQRVKDVCQAIRDADDARPIYINGAQYPMEVKRFMDATDNLVDMAGAYVGVGYDVTGVQPLILGNNSQGGEIPYNIAEINKEIEGDFRATLYAAIAEGAKGVVISKDESDDPISDYEWYNDLPGIKAEIASLMTAGIIQAPEASWGVSFPSDTITVLNWGTREVNGKYYLILANLRKEYSFNEYGELEANPVSVSTTITLNGLSADIKEVKDFFTGNTVISGVTGNVFDVTLPANGAVVYELSEGSTGINDIESNISVYPNPTTGNITVQLSDGNAQNVIVTNIMGAVVKQLPVHGKVTFSIANLANGVYFVKVGSKVTKIVLAK